MMTTIAWQEWILHYIVKEVMHAFHAVAQQQAEQCTSSKHAAVVAWRKSPGWG